MNTRRLRVLWVTNMFPTPDLHRGIFVGQQADALRAVGDVEIEVELVAQGRGASDYLRANPRVRRRWRQDRFDLVHVHYGITGLSTLLLPASVPLVFTFYGSDINLRLPHAISRVVARRARRRIFVAHRLAARWPSKRNVVIPNGVDFDACRPRPRTEACRALGLDPARKWVLFGSFPDRAVKGYDVFQEVLARVRRRYPEAETLILSEPGQSYARVVDKLNAADVLLFTSRRGQEGSPTVVKEALAIGLPVVTVDVGDVAETLDGVEPGVVIAWPDGQTDRPAWLERLAAGVVQVLGSERRANGRERRPDLHLPHAAERTLRLYREVLAAPR